MPAAAEGSELVELTLGLLQGQFGPSSRLGQREPLVLEKAEPGAELRGRAELLDLCTGVMEGAGGQRALVDREPFDRGFLECLSKPGDGVAIVKVVEVALSLARGSGDVEAGLVARAGEGDVAPLPQPLPADTEDEGALDGDALAGVSGERIGVAHVTVPEVAAAELDAVAAVGDDRQGPVLAVDCVDGGAGSVLHAEYVRVA